jgi:8-amino-7-oxononanoate synthase
MDGDYADVERLASLKRKYGFLLILDEAHATLVCGARGGGVAQARGRCADVDVHVGTLSKAVGAHGGFVACSREMKRFLVSRARGHMFSTALPAPVIAAALESLRVFADEPAIRAKLWRNVDRLNDTLATMARPVVSPIGSIVIGAPEAALAASAELLRRGFHVPAIRPPTVPAGTCRLRVALSASHRDQDIDDLARALEGAVATARAPRSRL